MLCVCPILLDPVVFPWLVPSPCIHACIAMMRICCIVTCVCCFLNHLMTKLQPLSVIGHWNRDWKGEEYFGCVKRIKSPDFNVDSGRLSRKQEDDGENRAVDCPSGGENPRKQGCHGKSHTYPYSYCWPSVRSFGEDRLFTDGFKGKIKRIALDKSDWLLDRELGSQMEQIVQIVRVNQPKNGLKRDTTLCTVFWCLQWSRSK